MNSLIIIEAIQKLKKYKELQYISAIIENLVNEVKCEECGGSGVITGGMNKQYECFACYGTGKKYVEICNVD